MSDLVSICIPAWERPELLLEAVESCLAQTYGNVEVVIADDSRTDRVREAVEPLLGDARLRYFRNEHRLGQAANTNRLFELARGERFILLHDDDILLPDATARLDECWQSTPGLIACYGKHHIATHQGTVLPDMTESTSENCRRVERYAGLQADRLWSVISGQFPADGFMIRTQAARRTLYRSEKDVGDACDFDFRLRLCALPGHFFFVNRYLSIYRTTDTSISTRPQTIDHAFEIVQNLDLPGELESVKAHFLRLRGPHAVRRYILSGQRRLAWALMQQAHYWPDGRFSRAFLSNVAVMLLPLRLALALRFAKHTARAKLRRHDEVYLRFLALRARIVTALGGGTPARQGPGARKKLRPGDRAAL